ncbi:MAG TPA: hypothetical protein VLZ77_05895 [Acidimicrobiales bacterium]|nr:hypothetical protein [Acidimicrobiales bacterium]
MGTARAGFFSFTEVTDPREHRSYNEWHQLDHMPEQYPLPGVLFGQRWVSTPACRRARLVDGPLLAPVHYVTLYLMGEPLVRTLEAFAALGQRLRDLGRFHEHRRSHLSGPFALRQAAAAPRVLVSADAVAFRPTRGVYVVVRDRAAPAPPGGGGRSHDEVERALAEALLGAPGVAGVLRFDADPALAGRRWHPGSRTITLCYLDEEPLSVAGALGAIVGDAAGEGMVFAGPFEAITPWRWDWFDAPP